MITVNTHPEYIRFERYLSNVIIKCDMFRVKDKYICKPPFNLEFYTRVLNASRWAYFNVIRNLLFRPKTCTDNFINVWGTNRNQEHQLCSLWAISKLWSVFLQIIRTHSIDFRIHSYSNASSAQIYLVFLRTCNMFPEEAFQDKIIVCLSELNSNGYTLVSLLKPPRRCTENLHNVSQSIAIDADVRHFTIVNFQLQTNYSICCLKLFDRNICVLISQRFFWLIISGSLFKCLNARTLVKIL